MNPRHLILETSVLPTELRTHNNILINICLKDKVSYFSLRQNLKFNEYDKILSHYCEQSFNFLSNDLIRQEILKMFNVSFPLNSFFNSKNTMGKKHWIKLTKKHFVQTGFEIGLIKCLNKIDLLIN